jgi:hypothetical protein
MKNEKIFIQIASYRDPELVPTIHDCIRKADNSENLVFSIAWQHSDEDVWDTLDDFKDDERFHIIDIKWNETKGTCWARNATQSKYNGEGYTLQIDSHHRFVKGWDTICKKMLSDLVDAGHEKPLLTAYLPSYDPDDDPGKRVKEVWKLNFDRFTPEGVIFMLPATLEGWQDEPLPVPTRFFSAHFVFAYGHWNFEVPYDPELYFHGEEISLAVRSYTQGYDLFIPNRIVAWHEYTRKGRAKHWDDNKTWEILNKNSLKRVKKLLNVDGNRDDTDFGIYGLGSVRTQSDYESFSGIRFEDRAVQTYTLDNFDAPNPLYRTQKSYERSFVNRFKHCIDLWKKSIDDSVDWDGWAVIFEDEDGKAVYRQDADRNEINQLKETHKDADFYNVWRTFNYKGVPYKWVIWPFSAKHGWGNKIEGILPRL